MFETQENQSEQNALSLIKTIKKSLAKGDLVSAGRRVSRVKSLLTDRNVERTTLGELLLMAASVSRAVGKKEQAVEFVMEILHGKGGMSIETLGRAKRLRARLLLDEGKMAEAEILAGTADRYIVTGLMEERVETASGREVRVNVPVEKKFLDNGEHISFETYFLLSEIAVLDGDWVKAQWHIACADEKYQNERIFPELQMWRGILAMATGESFIAVIEPVLDHGNAPAVLIGRIEALLGEDRRKDSPINAEEFSRFKLIGDLARRKPLGIIPDQTEIKNESFPDIIEAETLEFNQDISSDSSELKSDSSQINTLDLTRLSVLSVIEFCNMERLTGSIELSWNEQAVEEGIQAMTLHPLTRSGSGRIYCQNGRFIDADISIIGEFPDMPLDKKLRSEFALHQLLMTAVGGGCWTLLDQMKAETILESPVHTPKLLGRLIPQSAVGEREDVLAITSNINTCLDVVKMLDEIRGGVVNEEDDKEIDWDASWEPTAVSQTQTPVTVEETIEQSFHTEEPFSADLTETFDPVEPVQTSRAESSIPILTPVKFDDEENIFDLDKTDNQDTSSKTKADNFELQIEDVFAAPENQIVQPQSPPDANTSEKAEELIESELVEITDIPDFAPPWSNVVSGSSIPKGNQTEYFQAPGLGEEKPVLALLSEEIAGLTKSITWFEINERMVGILNSKFNCGVRGAVTRGLEELIVAAAGDDAENIADSDNPASIHNFAIIEELKWTLKTDRKLEVDEVEFCESLFEIGKLALLSINHEEGSEVRSIGGVTIADDDWLEKFMVPPKSLIMRKKINEAQAYASQDGVTLPNAHILLSGETGTGKDVFARLIHELSGRRNKQLIRADMGAIGSGDQFIATLFGAVKGAYTGQHSERKGLVEEAEGGTLFLNEIGNLGVDSQRALLDFMQEGCYTRLGDSKLRNANVRIILATNENINDAAKFRQDVKFRCAPPVTLPPLRDRREDIASLAVNFAGPDVVIREAAIKLLEFQSWQGNVRELDQIIKAAVAKIGGSGEIKASIIEEVLENFSAGQDVYSINFPVPPPNLSYSKALEAYEKFLLVHSLNVTGNAKSKAAQLWGESPSSITKKVKKWNLDDND